MGALSTSKIKPPNVMSTERIVLFNLNMTMALLLLLGSGWVWSMPALDWQVYLIALMTGVLSLGTFMRALRIGFEEWLTQRSFEKVWREADGAHSARFLTFEDLERAGCFEGGRLIGMFEGRPLFAPTRIEQSHSVYIAANGSGKTSCGVVPTILSLAHEMAKGRRASLCVTDTKSGEIIRQVAPVLDLLKIDYVILDDFNVLRDHPRRVRINPFSQLLWVRTNEPQSFRRLIDKIMHTLWPSPRNNGVNEYFFAEPRNRGSMATEDLTSVLGERLQPGAIWSVLNNPSLWTKRLKIMESSGSDQLRGEAAKVREYIAQKHEHEPSHMGAALRAFAPFAAGGWLHQLLPQTKDQPVFHHRELMERPCMLFIVGRSDLAADAAAYFGLHVQAAMHAQLTQPYFEVHYIAEEAANTPLKEMTEQMQVLRGLGARIHIVTQSEAGLASAYGDRATRIIMNEAIVKQYFGFTSFEEAEKLSNAMGREVVIKPSVSQSSGAHRLGRSWSVSREPLMLADRLMSLPFGDQIIHIGRLGFVHCQKVHSSHIGPYARHLGRNTIEDRDARVDIRFEL